MKEYIKNLRKIVGHIPLIICGASVIIYQNNSILLIHRVDNDNWGLPSGSLELSESLEEAALREVKEETNLEIVDIKLLNVYSGKDLYYKYPNGDEIYNVTVCYYTENFNGSIINSSESKNIKFYNINDLP